MNTCPCCSSTLLRHISHKKVIWFCLNCRQEMPRLVATKNNPVQAPKTKHLELSRK